MKRCLTSLGFAIAVTGLLGNGSLLAQEKTKEVTTTTTTTVTETVVKETTKWAPMKVCVLDFTTIDIKGQKQFLDEKNSPITIPPQSTLNDADRKSMDSVMQGYVRMIDAWDNTFTNEANRTAQVEDNQFMRSKIHDIYNLTVKGEPRPIVIGAEYLEAYLGKYNDVFTCVGAPLVLASMQKMKADKDFPNDFMRKLAEDSGVTHLVYGTVSDIRTKTQEFKGYGIQTKTTAFQLDVIIKMVDLKAQRTTYSNVYTGEYKEQRPVSEVAFDNNIFHSLMTSALKQAAEDFYEKCAPHKK